MESYIALWIPIIAIVGSFVMVVAIIWIIMRSKQRTAEYRSQVQMKMLDRFGSAAEFTQFLDSPAGKQFLNEPRKTARDRALGGIRSGIIMLFIGAGFMFGYFAERDPGFFIPGFICVGLGLGLLIAGAISFKMAKQWDTQQTQ